MDETRLRALLEGLRAGAGSVDAAVEALRGLPFEELGFAVVDHHRALRQGAAEVILGEGKTAEQIAVIAERIAARGDNVLVTRVAPEKAAEVSARLPAFVYAPVARTGTVEVRPITPVPGHVALLAAGTSDLPVAEECAETLRMLGVTHERVYDVGVAGLHRLLHRRASLEKADAVVVVAGMEGALPSVVGGLVSAPLVAVPTSVGYGASFHGLAALLGMLNACASGISVVNIDNGFGAAFAVFRMLRAAARPRAAAAPPAAEGAP